jgi:hypothetical protein
MIVSTPLAWLAAATPTAYIPFLYPLPYAWDYWYLLLLPLCIAVAIVYKSVKCASMSQVPREAATITLWILLGMVAAAAALAGVVALAAH